MTGDAHDDEGSPFYFRAKEYLCALLLATVMEHCSTGTGEMLDSGGVRSNAEDMVACAQGGLIQITGQEGGRIFGTVTPDGHALIERLRMEQERDRTAQAAVRFKHPTSKAVP